jgi:hypothetical protein
MTIVTISPRFFIDDNTAAITAGILINDGAAVISYARCHLLADFYRLMTVRSTMRP